MTVKDVLNLAVQYIGESDLSGTTTLGGVNIPTDQQTEKLNLLLTCVNDIQQTLALMYFPLKYSETVTSTGSVNFSSLTKTVSEILKIYDTHNFEVSFATYPTYLETIKGKLKIIYNYIPSELATFTSNLEVQADKVSKRMVAIGVVSRYFMLSGMYNDANEWEKMFERAILVASRSKVGKVVKKRRWA